MHNWYYDLQTKTRAYRTHANNSLLLSTHYTNSPTHTLARAHLLPFMRLTLCHGNHYYRSLHSRH